MNDFEPPPIPEDMNETLMQEPDDEFESEESEPIEEKTTNFFQLHCEVCKLRKLQILGIENHSDKFILQILCETCGTMWTFVLRKGLNEKNNVIESKKLNLGYLG